MKALVLSPTLQTHYKLKGQISTDDCGTTVELLSKARKQNLLCINYTWHKYMNTSGRQSDSSTKAQRRKSDNFQNLEDVNEQYTTIKPFVLLSITIISRINKNHLHQCNNSTNVSKVCKIRCKDAKVADMQQQILICAHYYFHEDTKIHKCRRVKIIKCIIKVCNNSCNH